MSSARYRISRRLGQGGMAEVFEAELAGELGFVRKVAIKRMLPEAASDPQAARRFLDEARIASRLHHANIVSVLDVGLLDGLPFQVLELVDGINALQLVQRSGGKLPLAVALAIAADVAHALDHAHAATDAAGVPLGIVHRDVKPANVLVSWAGDVKLGDFGIAVARDRVAHTEAGLVAGTRGFMAPEQRTRSTVDGRSDVFSLGLALHAMVTGYTPLEDVTVEMALLAGERIALDAALPADVARVIASAVEPARLDRPTAGELATSLAALVSSDRRTLLRKHLASVDGSAPKRGMLDQLLGIEVVPTSARPGEPASYELRPVDARDSTPTVGARPDRDVEAAALARNDAAVDPEASTALRPTDVVPRARAGTRIGIVAALAVAGGGTALWLGSRDHATKRDAGTGIDLAMGSSNVTAPIDAATGIDLAIGRTDGSVVIDVPPPADAAVVVVARRDAAVAHASRDAAAHADAAVRAAPEGTGYLQVVGEDMIGARVLVDGVVRGYPPAKIEVARGHHNLVVEKKDGSKVHASIEVTDLDTLANPLVPSF